MFSRKKPTSKSLVKPGREGERERVAALEEQLQSLSNTAVKAVDRATELEEDIQRLQKELYAKDQQLANSINRRMPLSNSISSIRSHISDKSSDSFSSLFSDSTALTHITSSDTSGPATGSVDGGDLVLLLKQKLEESEQIRKKLETALAEEHKHKASLEAEVEELKKELASVKPTGSSSSPTSEREGRLRTLEVSIRAINSARDALNRPRLYKYI